jgi:ribosomal protection tetracycline resistance protein
VSAGVGYVAYTEPIPCFAILRFRIEPGPRGSGLEYRSLVSPDDCLLRYQRQVERTVPQALRHGPLGGWPVTDLRVTLIEGRHHIYHINEGFAGFVDGILKDAKRHEKGLKKGGILAILVLLAFRPLLTQELPLLGQSASLITTFKLACLN